MSFHISEAKKKQGKKCCAYACNNAPVARKAGLCHKHYKRKMKTTDPVYVRYNEFVSNARRRGKEVRISIDQFREWCEDTGYIITKGLRGRNATIDRIKNNRPYEVGNIQLLTLSANVKKYHTQDKHEDCPF